MGTTVYEVEIILTTGETVEGTFRCPDNATRFANALRATGTVVEVVAQKVTRTTVTL
jgi:hypothetical protein